MHAIVRLVLAWGLTSLGAAEVANAAGAQPAPPGHVVDESKGRTRDEDPPPPSDDAVDDARARDDGAVDDAAPPDDGTSTDEPTDGAARKVRPPTDGAPTDGAPTDGEPTDAEPTDGAERSDMRVSGDDDNPSGLPDIVDLADPMAPVLAALDGLQAKGVSIGPIERTANPLQGEIITTSLAATDHQWVQFVLEQVAADGYAVLLRPAEADRYDLIVLRARPGQERGLAFISVDGVDVVGAFRPRESPQTLGKLIDVNANVVIPAEIADILRPIGYRPTLRPSAPGRLELRVVPGRTIRRVRVHGHTPLYERDIRRVLSQDSRPGSLAPGVCVPPAELRTRSDRESLPPLCRPGDLLCEAWEQTERSRVERYLFDEGFLRGTVDFAFACGKSDDEVELRVVLRKGKASRLRLLSNRPRPARAKSWRVEGPDIKGNLATGDQRWVRRVFRPTFGPVLPIPKRITRKAIENARDKVEREYATPRSGPRSRSRRGLALPYPGIHVETNYDRMRPGDAPLGDKVPLEVSISLGRGVNSGFLGNRRVSENRLRKQLQIFERREAANAGTATRESANLRAYYQTRGFMLARISGTFQDFGGLHKLTFDVVEGPKVRVRDATLKTPDNLPPRVQQAIEREYARNRGLKGGGRFTDTAARKDLGIVLAAYAQRGYLCARGQVRVAFWHGGLEVDGANATLDLGSELEGSAAGTWLTDADTGLSAAGLAALMKRDQAGAHVVIEIDPGPRLITSNIETIRHLELPIGASREVDSLPVTDGAWGAPRMFRGGPLRRGGDERPGRIPLTITKDRDVERDVVRRYNNAGYPLADSEIRWIYTDPEKRKHKVATAERLTDESLGLCQDHASDRAVQLDTEIAVYEGRRAVFGTTLVRGNFKTRYLRRNGKPAALAREIEWREGQVWGGNIVDRTRAGIDGMGVTENVVIRPQAQNCALDSDPSRPCVVHQVVSIVESKDRGMDLEWGFGGATLDPLYGFVRPTFPNMWGTAWDLGFDAHVGANVKAFRDLFCVGEDCFERSGRVSLTRQRIGGSPLTFDITGQVQRRVTPARGQIDSALGHVRLTWPISRKWRVYIGYLIQAANISKDIAKPTLGSDSGCGASGLAPCRPPNRPEAIVPDRTGAFQTGARWENVDNAFNPDDGIIATADAMLASPCFLGQDWWARVDFGWEHFIPMGRNQKRWNFRYALTYGHGIPIPLHRGCNDRDSSRTSSVPEVWRYFGGGARDLGLRGILPQTMLLDVEQIRGPYDTVTLRPTAQGGQIRALGTVAVQVVSVPNFVGGRLAHSVFMDFGVITHHWRQVVFNRDFRRSVGVNFIKWDIRIVTVSLGYAVLIPNWIWRGNVRAVDDQNGRFVFDVGATF